MRKAKKCSTCEIVKMNRIGRTLQDQASLPIWCRAHDDRAALLALAALEPHVNQNDGGPGSGCSPETCQHSIHGGWASCGECGRKLLAPGTCDSCNNVAAAKDHR